MLSIEFNQHLQGQERVEQGHAAALGGGAGQRAHQRGHAVREPGQYVYGVGAIHVNFC